MPELSRSQGLTARPANTGTHQTQVLDGNFDLSYGDSLMLDSDPDAHAKST